MTPTPTPNPGAWPAAPETLAVCVLYTCNDMYDDEGTHRPAFTLYENVPVSAHAILLERLGDQRARGLVKHFSLWSSAGDAIAWLRLASGTERNSYAALRQRLE